MPITRGQMKRQLYMGGGIMDIVPREQALLGGVKKAIKKAGKTVKKVASSDVGKAALLYAAGAGLGSIGTGQVGLERFALSNFLGNIQNIPSVISGGLGSITENVSLPTFISDRLPDFKTVKDIGIKGAVLGGLTKFLTSTLGMSEEEAQAIGDDPEQLGTYLRLYYQNLNPNASEEEVEEFVRLNSAEGGRIGFANGPVLPPDPTQPVNPFGPKPGDFGIDEDIPIKMASNIENDKILEALFEKYLDMGLSPKDAAEAAQKEFERMSMMKTEGRGLAALGGKMDTASDNAMQAAGVEGLPVRQNPKGVKELDLRKTGGFIPPVGIKEKADDIPAMLSNNEFVFTADAVRGAGGGDVNLGAQRMYDTMKRLEAGGRA